MKLTRSEATRLAAKKAKEEGRHWGRKMKYDHSQIKQLRQEGMNMDLIADKMGCSIDTVKAVLAEK